MKNSKLRRALLLLACAVMLVSLSVGATLAYLTAETGKVENTFSVGKVTFDDEDDDNDGITTGLDEALVNEYGKPIKDATKPTETCTVAEAPRVVKNKYKLLPGHTYTKDPTVHIGSDSENAWLFVKVVNGIEAIEADDVKDADGNVTTAVKIASQMEAKGWVLIDANNGIWAWPNQVVASQDIPVFDSFTLDGAVQTGTQAQAEADKTHVAGNKYVGDYVDASITIQAYIVQADGLTTYTAAWAAAPLAAWTTTTAAE